MTRAVVEAETTAGDGGTTGNGTRVVVAGGGHGAHVVVATLAVRTSLEVVWYLPYRDEAERVLRALRAAGLTVVAPTGEWAVDASRLVVTRDPRLAAGAGAVLLVAPAFAHESLLEQLSPWLGPGTVVAAIPARGGLEYQVGDLAKRVPGLVVCGSQTLPWACRIEVFGQRVRVLGAKARVLVGCRPPSRAAEVARRLSAWLGVRVVPAGGLTAMTLANTGQILHPGLMYVHVKRLPRRPLASGELPFFYQDAGEEGTRLVAALSAEVMALKEALLRYREGLDLGAVVDIFAWLKEAYRDQIEDDGDLARALASNRAYRGIRLPVVEVPGGCRPDLESRYLTEDVPFGLLVTRGLAELAGVPTPVVDRVLAEVGEWMGVPWLRDGRLSPEGVARSRAPQRYGINTLAQALAGELDAGCGGGDGQAAPWAGPAMGGACSGTTPGHSACRGTEGLVRGRSRKMSGRHGGP